VWRTAREAITARGNAEDSAFVFLMQTKEKVAALFGRAIDISRVLTLRATFT
jgi:hypothetical protein